MKFESLIIAILILILFVFVGGQAYTALDGAIYSLQTQVGELDARVRELERKVFEAGGQ